MNSSTPFDPRLAIYQGLTEAVQIEADGGRILAAVHPADPTRGTLSAPEGNAAVIAAGEAWLAERGCTSVWAPMEVCTWFPYRAVTATSDQPEVPLEPTAAAEPWRERGYSEAAHYVSSYVDPHAYLAYAASAFERSEAAGIRFRPVRADALEDELRSIFALTMLAFSSALGFVPIPEHLFVALYVLFADRLDPDLAYVAEREDGTVVGYVFGFMTQDNAGEPVAVAKTAAVHPDVGRCGAGTALIAKVHEEAVRRGCRRVIHALMAWDGISHGMTAYGHLSDIRRYALFERDL